MALSEYERSQRNERHRTWVNSLVASAQQHGWFGDMTLFFQDGKIVRVKKNESLIPPVAKQRRPG